MRTELLRIMGEGPTVYSAGRPTLIFAALYSVMYVGETKRVPENSYRSCVTGSLMQGAVDVI